MPFRWQKRIKIAPGVRVSLSPKVWAVSLPSTRSSRKCIQFANNPIERHIMPRFTVLAAALILIFSLITSHVWPRTTVFAEPRPSVPARVDPVAEEDAREVDPSRTDSSTANVAATTTATVAATVETDPVHTSGDSADDTAIWIHPSDPSRSTVIGTDKQAGIAVYRLDGREVQYLPDGRMNNIDLRYNLPLAGRVATIVTASNRTNSSIAVYHVDETTGMLANIAARTISTGISPYGLCMYRSSVNGKYYVFVNSGSGAVEQWELFDNGTGKIDGKRVRTFSLGSKTEGCVADDVHGVFYISEETVGIWKYGAEPGAGTDRVLVDSVGTGGHLTADVEGLTMYYTSTGAGYLLASSQGSNAYVAYHRDGSNAYVTTFTIGAGNGIDAATRTDGIDVTNVNLGQAFPAGVFVAQDIYNDGLNQNFKLVPWDAIVNVTGSSLSMDTTWDPRAVGRTDTPTSPPTSSTNLLGNGSFEELAAGTSNKPAVWSTSTTSFTTSSTWTRSSTSKRSGTYAGKQQATDSYIRTYRQVVSNLNAGKSYTYAGWVNIPTAPTTSGWTFRLEVTWRNSSNAKISTSQVKSYTAATSGWNQFTANLVAPDNTSNADVRIVASGVNNPIYIDDVSFTAAP